MSFTARHFWINVFINIVCQRFRNIGIIIKYIITIIITIISIYYYYYNFLSWKKIYDYRNTWDLIKTTIIVIISKCGQGKTYTEYEAGKNIRARLHETRSELEPVWDFTSVWGNFIINLHMTFGGVKLTSVKLTEVIFQTAVSLTCKQ